MDYNYRQPPVQPVYGNPQYGQPQGYPPYNAPAPQSIPQANNYGYAPPPQPPANPFKAFYAQRLAQLTFNSRPIIQDLSVIAQDQCNKGDWANMQSIVEAIEAAVLRASPQSKLPVLYLIDSISKNIGAPYTTILLPPIIPRLYQKTYREVDGVTKAKMEEMIALWRTGGPNHTDLYGPEVRLAIERDIFGTAGAAARQSQPPMYTRDRVMQTLHSTMDLKQRESTAKPWDPAPRHQVAVLQQISQLLSTTNVGSQELQRIMEQLKSMNPPPPPVLTPQTSYTPPYHGQPAVSNSAGPSLPPFPPPLIRNPPAMQSYSSPVANGHTPVPISSTPVPPSTATPLPAPVPLAAAIPANVADILRNLNSTGIISNPRTPETGSASLPGKNLLASYEEMILSLDVRLESLDLNKMTALPTSHLPVRCKQCGIRFPEGESKMQAHLDWHFRRNKSKTETGGRGAHRRWLPKSEEWVNDFSGNAEAGPSTATALTNSPSTTVGAKLSVEQLARYASRTVRAPTDPLKAGKPCPICKEPFKAELEDDEWIWRNALEINGTIYHATCRAEQMNARKNAKLLNPNGRLSASKSPGLTPQPGDTGHSLIKTESFIPKGLPEILEVKMEPEEQKPADVAESVSDPAHEDGLNVPAKRKADEEGEDDAKRVKVEDQETVEKPLSQAGSAEALAAEITSTERARTEQDTDSGAAEAAKTSNADEIAVDIEDAIETAEAMEAALADTQRRTPTSHITPAEDSEQTIQNEEHDGTPAAKSAPSSVSASAQPSSVGIPGGIPGFGQ